MTPWILILLLVGVVQGSALSRLSAFGVHPNLMLAVVVSWSLLRGGREGLIWGAVGGLLLDLLSSAPFGTFTLALLVTTFFTGLTEVSLFRPTLVLPVGIMFLASPLFHLTAMVTMQTLGWPVHWAHGWSMLLPAAALDALLTFLLFPLLRRLSARAGDRGIRWGQGL